MLGKILISKRKNKNKGKEKKNNEGKENNAIFLKTWPSLQRLKTNYRHALHHMSLKTFQTVQRRFNRVTKNSGSFKGG